jgi:hypothetical protein
MLAVRPRAPRRANAISAGQPSALAGVGEDLPANLGGGAVKWVMPPHLPRHRLFQGRGDITVCGRVVPRCRIFVAPRRGRPREDHQEGRRGGRGSRGWRCGCHGRHGQRRAAVGRSRSRRTPRRPPPAGAGHQTTGRPSGRIRAPPGTGLTRSHSVISRPGGAWVRWGWATMPRRRRRRPYRPRPRRQRSRKPA